MDQDLYEALCTLHPWVKAIPDEWHRLSDEELTVTDLGQIMSQSQDIQNYYGLRTGAFVGVLGEEGRDARGEEFAVVKASDMGRAAKQPYWDNPEVSTMWSRGFLLGTIIGAEQRRKGAPTRPLELHTEDPIGTGSEELDQPPDTPEVVPAAETEIVEEDLDTEASDAFEGAEADEPPLVAADEPVVVEGNPPAASPVEATRPPATVPRRDFLKGAIASGAVMLGAAYLLLGRGSSEDETPSDPAVIQPVVSTATPPPADTPTPTPVPPPAPGTVLYETDWSNGGADGWDFPSRWGILNGVLTIPESSAFVGPHPFVVVPVSPAHPDYAIEVEWRWLEDHGFGHLLYLVIRDRYLFVFTRNYGTSYTISKMPENFDEVFDTSSSFTSGGDEADLDGNFHIIRFEAKGKTLTASFDGSVILQANGDNEYIPGRTGLSGFHKSEVRSLRVVAT